jgi:uncharacterized protein (TIGR03083 family)
MHSCHDRSVLTRDTYLARLRADADSFLKILRSADLETRVPSCPGWSLTDLALHVSGVHRWAYAAVVTGAPGTEPVGPSDRAALVEWFDAGAAQLLDILAETDPATPTWTFGPKPRTVQFWVRRQPHETSMHLGDAQRALGIPTATPPEFAADGVDEVVTVMFPRQVRLERIPPLVHGVRLRARDVDSTWVLAGDGTDPTAPYVATVTGTAHELLLAVWRRLDAETLDIEGDADAVRAAFGCALTP